jgi:hypothetical protein
MGTLYSGDVYAPKKSTDDLVVATHRVLQRLGLTLDEPPSVSVIDTEADEDLPEYRAVDLPDAIQYMRRCPCTTALEYFLPGLRPDPQGQVTGIAVTVFFASRSALSTVGLSFLGSSFRADKYPDAHPRVVAVMEALHNELGALRSGFDWGLYDVVDEETEARALELSDVQPRPSQWLDIIDKGLVTPGIKELYQRETKPGSVLRTTANGSLFWQRDAGPP